MSGISVLILTRNEETDIGACLDSVAWSDDVHVFDSESTDRTLEIARAHGAHVAQRRFDSYAGQRNAALSTLPFRHEWIFVLDADERVTAPLAREMLAAVAVAAPQTGAFRVRRHDYFMGRHLKHAQMAAWYVRLLRRGRARYTREVNEVLEVDGTIGELHSAFTHNSFSKGLSRWFEKHNAYSSMEAQILADGAFRREVSLKAALFEPDFHQRRRAQKAIFYCLPCRPLLRWLLFLFVRGGILDGYPGLVYSTLQAFYEWMIVLKTDELLRQRSLAEEIGSYGCACSAAAMREAQHSSK